MMEIRRITDAKEVAGLVLSPLDAAECFAGGMDADTALTRSVAGSTASYAHMAGGDVVCVWGYRVRSLLVGGVDMWLLGTPGVRANSRAFIRESREICEVFLREFGSIRAIVWEGHAPALRWLGWLGFEVRETVGPFVIVEKRFEWGS